jgi:thiol-disulfide isomerase/thioredoxin
MMLETMRPDEAWRGSDEIREWLGRAGLTYRVWGGDWCGDCRAQLPAFAAALDAAGVPADRIEAYPLDEDKQGEGVEAYGIERIPTVVVERDGEEVARFVEEEPVSIAAYLAERIAEAPIADD